MLTWSVSHCCDSMFHEVPFQVCMVSKIKCLKIKIPHISNTIPIVCDFMLQAAIWFINNKDEKREITLASNLLFFDFISPIVKKKLRSDNACICIKNKRHLFCFCFTLNKCELTHWKLYSSLRRGYLEYIFYNFMFLAWKKCWEKAMF